MSTNNQKNRHLSQSISTLNEASVPQPTADQQPEQRPPFVPDAAVAAERRHTGQANRPANESRPPPATDRPRGNTAQNIIIFLLILTLSLLGFVAYWGKTTLDRLESQITALAFLSPSTDAPATAAENDNLGQLRQQLLGIQEEIASLKTSLGALPKTLSDDLTEIKTAVTQAGTEKLPEKPAPKASIAAPKASKTLSAHEKPWFVNLATFYTKDSTAPMLKRVRQLGLTPNVTAADIGGKAGYRIQLNGLGSRDEAEQLAETLEQKLKLNGLWVGQE